MEHFSKDVRKYREWRAPARMALAVLAALTFIAIAAAARAEVKPGDFDHAGQRVEGKGSRLAGRLLQSRSTGCR